MRLVCSALVLSAVAAAHGQRIPPSDRQVPHFAVHDASRLSALANLGALTKTTILVEAGPLPFLQAHVSIALEQPTVLEVVRQLLGDAYALRDEGALLIISPASGANNRVLDLWLGEFKFQQTSLSSLLPWLEFKIRYATGCNPQGFGWAGPEMEIGLAPMQFADATFEQVLGKVAAAQEPSMWIVLPEPQQSGCIESPGSQWQVGLYGFGNRHTSCQQPFSESSGRDLLGMSPKDHPFPESCPQTSTPATSEMEHPL